MSPTLAIVAVASGIPAGWLAGRMAQVSLEGRDDIPAPLPDRVRPLLAAVVPLLFVLVAEAVGERWVLAGFLVFTAVTAALAVTDIHARIIPDILNFPGTVLAAALLAGGALLDGHGDLLVRAAAGGAIYYAFLLVTWLATAGRAMGGGDVKLAFSLGLFTAYLGWGHLFVAVFGGILLGAVTGIVLLLGRLRRWRDHFAYGPPLVVGAYVAIAFARPILEWYLG